MANKPVVFDDDIPEWTKEDFARARQGSKVLPSEFLKAFKRTPGRPKGSTTSNKTLVSLRLDNDVLEKFKARGPGWQSRINEALRKAAG
jgi:uncharacterized protein (DUF4415 family)